MTVDSAIKYNDDASSARRVHEFTPTEAKTSLIGRVTNQTDAAKSVTLKISSSTRAGTSCPHKTFPLGPMRPRRASISPRRELGRGIAFSTGRLVSTVCHRRSEQAVANANSPQLGPTRFVSG
jgi:hypothetical protein